MTTNALIGCSGWSYPSWRDVLYPHDLAEREWLRQYAASFDVVEVNASFYRLPTRSMVEHWAEQTPNDFLFAVKASRYLTHVRRLREIGEGTARLRERIEPLARAGKLGPILWQLPENFHRDNDRLAQALDELGPGKHAFEFRHESWFVPEVAELLRRHRVAMAHADSVRRPLPAAVSTASWGYVRLHDGRGKHGNYSQRQLRGWAERLRADGRETFVFFNNDWEGYAVRNARRLRDLLDSKNGASRRNRSIPSRSRP